MMVVFNWRFRSSGCSKASTVQSRANVHLSTIECVDGQRNALRGDARARSHHRRTGMSASVSSPLKWLSISVNQPSFFFDRFMPQAYPKNVFVPLDFCGAWLTQHMYTDRVSTPDDPSLSALLPANIFTVPHEHHPLND